MLGSTKTSNEHGMTIRETAKEMHHMEQVVHGHLGPGILINPHIRRGAKSICTPFHQKPEAPFEGK